MRILLLIISLALPAAAYLDPVTGNLIVQGVLAGIAALAVAYGNFKSRIQAWLGKTPDSDESEDSESDKEQETESEEGQESEPEEESTDSSDAEVKSV